MESQKKVNAKSVGAGSCVDQSMLTWLQELNAQTADSAKFDDVLKTHLQELKSNLNGLHSSVSQNDFTSLETLALEISHNSLKIGAINMLKAAFDLQNVARLKASSEALQIVDQIEKEYHRVQASFENVV